MPNGLIMDAVTKTLGSMTGIGLWEIVGSAAKTQFAPSVVDEEGKLQPNWKGIAIKDVIKLGLSGLTFWGATRIPDRGAFGGYTPEIKSFLDGMAAGGAGTVLLDIVNESYNVTAGSDANAIEAWIRAQMTKE